jgi:hypothetical protein
MKSDVTWYGLDSTQGNPTRSSSKPGTRQKREHFIDKMKPWEQIPPDHLGRESFSGFLLHYQASCGFFPLRGSSNYAFLSVYVSGRHLKTSA